MQTIYVRNTPSNKLSDCGVYTIPCKVCDQMYIGETGRDLSIRIKDHKKDIVNRKIESGVANHVLTTGHNLDFDKARVVSPCPNTTKRHILLKVY